MQPDEGVRVKLKEREEKRRGENLLVTWSRSTSVSSIFRYFHSHKNLSKQFWFILHDFHHFVHVATRSL